ncbi:MAG: RidA family protein [Proteobacteria bacterium]|nr:RidA family protein [Pseudomonadota bacterium]MDA1058335.1 RidA family protein [Pseudomonadota bacterium]
MSDPVPQATDKNAYRIKTNPDPYDAFKIALGYRAGNLIFLSGQASIDETGALVGVGDFDRQVEQTFANIKRALEAAGSSMEKIIKVNIYLTDMANFPKIIEARGKYFKQPWPADTIVEVGALGLPELQIEIEAIALIEGEVIG